MSAYVPEHGVRAGMLAAKIYEGWLVAAATEDANYTSDAVLARYFASTACDAAAILIDELRRRDVQTCKPIHGDLPTDSEMGDADGNAK